MDADVPVVESGGKKDFRYGNEPSTWYPPAKVDRVLHDGDEVKLGNAVLVAHKTAGHTKGCTTWTMKVTRRQKRKNLRRRDRRQPQRQPRLQAREQRRVPANRARLRTRIRRLESVALRHLPRRPRRLLRHGRQISEARTTAAKIHSSIPQATKPTSPTANPPSRRN